MSRRAVLVWFDREENTVELDIEESGLSSFEVAGALALALELATEALPTIQYQDTEDEESEE